MKNTSDRLDAVLFCGMLILALILIPIPRGIVKVLAAVVRTVVKVIWILVAPFAATGFVACYAVLGVCIIAASNLAGSNRRYKQQLSKPEVYRY
jgi:hypothetical protein